MNYSKYLKYLIKSDSLLSGRLFSAYETSVAATQKQEVVQIPLWETESHPDTVPVSSPSVCLEMQGIRIEIHEQAGADVIRNTLLALRQLC